MRERRPISRASGPDRARARRPGFVLLAVLWVMVGAIALGLALTLASRRAVGAARNRRAAIVAAWMTEGCLERARAAIGAALAERMGEPGDLLARWRALDRAVPASAPVRSADCSVSLTPAGRALDVNAAGADQLARLFRALRVPEAAVDTLVDAVLDWRDPDDLPRPHGAEAPWYAARGRPAPRNAPFAHRRELARVHGLDSLAASGIIDSVLDVEPGRVDLNHAPLAVLASLPGFTTEVLAAIGVRRERGVPITDLLAVAAQLSPNARTALAAHYAELSRLATADPDAWIVTARGKAGAPPITAVVEARLVRAGRRAAIVRRREWLE